MKRFQSVLFLLLILPGLLWFSILGTTRASAYIRLEQESIDKKVQDLFNSMSPEERVGQLFLISFQGTDIGPDSSIYNLIKNYHVGGVILMSSNNNFTGSTTVAADAYSMISDLQQINWVDTGVQTGETSSPYIPLLVALSQEGDGYPNDQILRGLTPLPNQMALGATWSPELAASVGEVMGSELAALGVNLLIGPSLDVLDLDYSEGGEALGTRSFGENPYWVGKLGQAYIEGVHNGSEGKLLVVATHFPGQGSSDRNPADEIAVVSKSYPQLLAEDLAPFFSVTGNAANPSSTADGLLAAHLRFESLQGSIRSSTRPFSLDSSAVEQVMSLPELSGWRSDGGILISENLGSNSIRKFYDPNNLSFDARQVARNAIISGMDLLYLDDFVATGDIDQATTVIRTLDFFVQKYMEDSAFSQRVDTSVKRILAKKFSLYGGFNPAEVTSSEANLANLGKSSAVSFEVAQRSITLLHPSSEDYVAAVPSAPGISDRTVFFTDYQLYKQCSSCNNEEMIAPDALRRSVIKLYGPDASGDTAQYLLSTFSFNDLLSMLNGEEEGKLVEDELRAADWVVFAFMDVDPTRPASMALKQLLDKRSDLLINKYSMAFAFNAPYYLDATEISKLSAYYAVYSKIPAFTDVAARVLFQEIVPVGKLPVSLRAIGYDLNFATSPAPEQTIDLTLDTDSLPSADSSRTPQPDSESGVPSFRTGDSIPLKTGQILDRNANLVPDGTVVTFSFSMDGETDFVHTLTSTTVDGVARTEYLIPTEGRLDISVSSGEAVSSNKLVLNITKGEAAVVTVIVPTSMPTRTPTPTQVVPTETPSPTVEPALEEEEKSTPNGADWLFSMLLVWGASFGIYMTGRGWVNQRWCVRWALLAAYGGICAYIDVTLGIGGIEQILAMGRFGGIFLATLIGLGCGWLAGWLWYRNFLKRLQKSRASLANKRLIS